MALAPSVPAAAAASGVSADAKAKRLMYKVKVEFTASLHKVMCAICN